MSFIHNALKKVQQRLTPKSTQAAPPPTAPAAANPNYIYADPSKEGPPAEETALEIIPSSTNKIKSILSLILALIVILGSLAYVCTTFKLPMPLLHTPSITMIPQMILRKTLPPLKTTAPTPLPPLAKITVPLATTQPSTAPNEPITLNVHGVMANGASNVVLINDQVYQEGDDIDGVKILKIDLDKIKVINNGKEETISVKN